MFFNLLFLTSCNEQKKSYDILLMFITEKVKLGQYHFVCTEEQTLLWPEYTEFVQEYFIGIFA